MAHTWQALPSTSLPLPGKMIRGSGGFPLLLLVYLLFFTLRLPDPNEQGWKDVVRVNPNDVATIYVPFRETVCLLLFSVPQYSSYKGVSGPMH